jgi:hypothetical protein
MALSNERHQIKTFPTPLPIDLIFYEVVDSAYERNNAWEYGQAHWDTKNYPNHILVFVAPQPPSRDVPNRQFWYYAANREDQDLYNWTSGIANIAGMRFDTVERIYVFRRDDYNPEELQMGDPMPNIPVNRFPDPVTTDGDNTTNDDSPPLYTNHVLAERDQMNSSDEVLNSIFIVEKRVYVKRCSITTIQTEDFFGIGGSKVDTWHYRSEVVDGVTVETHFADPNSSYWGWQADGTQRDGLQISENWYIISNISSITDAIDDYVFTYPTLTNINLPRRLVDTQLTFNVNSGEGNQDQDGFDMSYGELPLSTSLGLTDSCSSSISISPEVGLTFEDPDGGFTPATVYSFFLPQPVTMQDIIDRVTALHGSPVAIYTPAVTKTAVMTLVSGSASVRASATTSQGKTVKTDGGSVRWEKSVSTDKSVGQSTQFVQVSGFLGDLNLTSTQTSEVSAVASMAIVGFGYAEGMVTSAFIEDTASATASVTTSGEGGSEGSSGGAFIVDINVEHYRFERAKIFIVVVDL